MEKSKKMITPVIWGALAMSIVVLASNILVQYPVQYNLGTIALADLLTWGAFTYPIAFLVTDLINRNFGPTTARYVVIIGFVVAVILSIIFSNPRIAIASGSAFLVAQLLDVTIFDRLRQLAWWKAPIVSSVLGTVIDTFLFFTLAFSAWFSIFGYNDAFALENAKLFGVFAVEMPRWISWAVGDLGIKLLVVVSLLVPYRVLTAYFQPVNGMKTA